MKNIAIALNAGQPIQRNAITNFLAGAKWAYWHWVDDFWIVQVPDSYGPKALHDHLQKLPAVSTAIILVFEFSGGIKYWGKANKDAWAWLRYIGIPE